MAAVPDVGFCGDRARFEPSEDWTGGGGGLLPRGTGGGEEEAAAEDDVGSLLDSLSVKFGPALTKLLGKYPLSVPLVLVEEEQPVHHSPSSVNP